MQIISLYLFGLSNVIAELTGRCASDFCCLSWIDRVDGSRVISQLTGRVIRNADTPELSEKLESSGCC